MNRPSGKWIALVLLPVSAAASGFEEALEKAQRSEDALDSKQMVRLAEALNQPMGKALTRCTPPREKIPTEFAVVFRIGADGRVAQSWTQHGSAFEHCFAATMREGIRFVPPSAPFYTAID